MPISKHHSGSSRQLGSNKAMPEETVAHFMKNRKRFGSLDASPKASSDGIFEGIPTNVPSSVGGPPVMMRASPPISEIQQGIEEQVKTAAVGIAGATNRQAPQRSQGIQDNDLELSSLAEQVR
jgi:hypothetical protein